MYARVYFMWYKFIQDEFNLKTSKGEDLDWFHQNSINNISRCYFTKGYVLVLKTPDRIRRNATSLHSTNSPAIDYKGYGMYYVNGRRLEKDMFEKCLHSKLSFEEFLAIDNEDVKACIITMIKENRGNEGLLEFLGAECVDSRKIVHNSGHLEEVKLFKTKDKYEFLQDRYGNFNQPYAWTQMQCPSTGQTYLIDTSADFTDAIESMKFHRPEPVPFELDYNFSIFNN